MEKTSNLLLQNHFTSAQPTGGTSAVDDEGRRTRRIFSDLAQLKETFALEISKRTASSFQLLFLL